MIEEDDSIVHLLIKFIRRAARPFDVEMVVGSGRYVLALVVSAMLVPLSWPV